MEAEKLKVIAEGMGNKARIVAPDSPQPLTEAMFVQVRILTSKKDSSFLYWTEYNPLTNNDQMVEIMKKLSKELSKKEFYYKIACAKDMTINEAVCNEAYEYFNNQ